MPGPWQQERAFSALPGSPAPSWGLKAGPQVWAQHPEQGPPTSSSEEFLGVSCNHTAARWDQTGAMGCADQALGAVGGDWPWGGKGGVPGLKSRRPARTTAACGPLDVHGQTMLGGQCSAGPQT